jgi:hypothetical protein
LTERKEGKVRSLAESVLFYVGIPAATLYPLGVLGLGIQLWMAFVVSSIYATDI